jgi:hypothetical protein
LPGLARAASRYNQGLTTPCPHAKEVQMYIGGGVLLLILIILLIIVLL